MTDKEYSEFMTKCANIPYFHKDYSWLKEHCYRTLNKPCSPNTRNEHLAVLDLIKEHEERQKWIKCSDDLPDMDVDVLGTTKDYGDVAKFTRMKSYLNDAGWEWVLTDDIEGTSYRPDEIIAWMPLPEPYKGE